MPTRSEAAVTRCAPMAFNAEGENGPASEDLATDAHDCIMVGHLGSTEYKVVVRRATPAGPPLDCLHEPH